MRPQHWLPSVRYRLSFQMDVQRESLLNGQFLLPARAHSRVGKNLMSYGQWTLMNTQLLAGDPEVERYPSQSY